MSKDRLTMPEFAAVTGRPIEEVKDMVSYGRIRTTPGRYLTRDELGYAVYVPMIDKAAIDGFYVHREPDVSENPGARRQAVFDQAAAKRQLQVHEEIDRGDPRVRHARAMEKWQKLNKSASEALDEMSAASQAMGDNS